MAKRDRVAELEAQVAELQRLVAIPCVEDRLLLKQVSDYRDLVMRLRDAYGLYDDSDCWIHTDMPVSTDDWPACSACYIASLIKGGSSAWG